MPLIEVPFFISDDSLLESTVIEEENVFEYRSFYVL